MTRDIERFAKRFDLPGYEKGADKLRQLAKDLRKEDFPEEIEEAIPYDEEQGEPVYTELTH